jgi:hypothetical protein
VLCPGRCLNPGLVTIWPATPSGCHRGFVQVQLIAFPHRHDAKAGRVPARQLARCAMGAGIGFELGRPGAAEPAASGRSQARPPPGAADDREVGTVGCIPYPLVGIVSQNP